MIAITNIELIISYYTRRLKLNYTTEEEMYRDTLEVSALLQGDADKMKKVDKDNARCMKCGINLAYLDESEIYYDKDENTYCKACYSMLDKKEKVK